MKYILTSITFSIIVLNSFSQAKKGELTVFANTGFTIGAQGLHPGIGGGLQLGFPKEKGTFIFEGSYIFFATRDDVFNNRYDRSWAVIRPGFNFPFGKNMYGQINGGGILETGNQGVEGYGAVLGGGFGFKPPAGDGHLDVFAKFNLLLGSLSASHYIAVGIGYAIPFNKQNQ